jgi:polysaccharide biosynthesis acetyltransferase WcbI-like protein
LALKLGVVGICQVHGFGLALARLLPDAQVRVFEAPVVHAHGRSAETADCLCACDKVFAHRLADDFAELATSRLQQRVSALSVLPRIIFTGWHPDIAYLIHQDRELMSPVGAYHSAIAASAFSLGYTPDETELLFNRFVFARLGYLQEYEASWTLLVRDFVESGLAPHLELERWRKTGPFMHTVNHPKVSALAKLARASAIATGLVDPDGPVPAVEYDHLAWDTGWPVYPEIAEELGVVGDYLFKRRSEVTPSGVVPLLRLPEFIRESFEMYRSYPEEAFSGKAVAAARRTIESLSGIRGGDDGSASSRSKSVS